MKIPRNVFIFIWCVFALIVFIYDMFKFFMSDSSSGNAYPMEYLLILSVFIGYIFLYLKNSPGENNKEN